MPDIGLDAEDVTVNRTDTIPALMELPIQDGVKWLHFQILQNFMKIYK